MVDKQARIVWTKHAEKQLHDLYEHISSDSPQNALKVVKDIVAGIEKAVTNP